MGLKISELLQNIRFLSDGFVPVAVPNENTYKVPLPEIGMFFNLYMKSEEVPPPVGDFWLCDSYGTVVTGDFINELHNAGVKFIVNTDINLANNSRIYTEAQCVCNNNMIRFTFLSWAEYDGVQYPIILEVSDASTNRRVYISSRIDSKLMLSWKTITPTPEISNGILTISGISSIVDLSIPNNYSSQQLKIICTQENPMAEILITNNSSNNIEILAKRTLSNYDIVNLSKKNYTSTNYIIPANANGIVCIYPRYYEVGILT